MLLGLKSGAPPAAPAPPLPCAPAPPRARGGYEHLTEEAPSATDGSERGEAPGEFGGEAPCPALSPRVFAAAPVLRGRLAALLVSFRSEVLPQLLTPPVVAALSGALVGLLPFGPQLVVKPASPFGWAFAAAAKLGAAAVPLNLLVLGASLSKGFVVDATGWKPLIGVAAVRCARRAACVVHWLCFVVARFAHSVACAHLVPDSILLPLNPHPGWLLCRCLLCSSWRA